MTLTITQPSRFVRDFVYCDEELTYMVNRHNRDDPENRLTKELVEDVRDLILDYCDESSAYCVTELSEEQNNEMACSIQQTITGKSVCTITPETAHKLNNIIFQECIRNYTLTVTGLCGEQTVRMVGNLQAQVLNSMH